MGAFPVDTVLGFRVGNVRLKLPALPFCEGGKLPSAGRCFASALGLEFEF